jgi:hypothetical protein
MGLRADVRLTALLVGAVLVTGVEFVSAAAEQLVTAHQQARRLQQTARVLRNGATAGASAPVLAAEVTRLRADLDGLASSHERWAAALPPERRASVAPQLARVEQGCARMRASLLELERVVASATLDRSRVQSLGQSIGRQAGLCSRALRKLAE